MYSELFFTRIFQFNKNMFVFDEQLLTSRTGEMCRYVQFVTTDLYKIGNKEVYDNRKGLNCDQHMQRIRKTVSSQ